MTSPRRVPPDRLRSDVLDDVNLTIAYDLSVNGDVARRREGRDYFGDLCLKFPIPN
ncbi:MAG: hypothetical protein WCH39_25690 [Schlesneria sp.]